MNKSASPTKEASPGYLIRYGRLRVRVKQRVRLALENALNLLELSNFHPENRGAVDAFNPRRRQVAQLDRPA